jgi:hypothetical protein
MRAEECFRNMARSNTNAFVVGYGIRLRAREEAKRRLRRPWSIGTVVFMAGCLIVATALWALQR